MRKQKLTLYISALILLSIVSRIYAAYFFADTNLKNEWGVLVHNLDLTGILGLNVVVDQFNTLHQLAKLGDKVLPSVFMPPLYAYFIYIIKILFNNSFDTVKLVIFCQIFLSLISTYLFFKIARQFEKIKTSLVFTFFFPFFLFMFILLSKFHQSLSKFFCYFLFIFL